jgi:ABC transporter substrate binding protein
MREALPQVRHLGILWDAASRDQAEAAAAAKSLGFEPRRVEVVGQPPDYAAALGQMADVPGEPVVIPAGPIFLRDRAILERLLLERRIPSIGAFREIVEAGGLISYGIDLVGLFRDAAGVVDQIAKGAKPAELPIVQASRSVLPRRRPKCLAYAYVLHVVTYAATPSLRGTPSQLRVVNLPDPTASVVICDGQLFERTRVTEDGALEIAGAVGDYSYQIYTGYRGPTEGRTAASVRHPPVQRRGRSGRARATGLHVPGTAIAAPVTLLPAVAARCPCCAY